MKDVQKIKEQVRKPNLSFHSFSHLLLRAYYVPSTGDTRRRRPRNLRRSHSYIQGNLNKPEETVLKFPNHLWPVTKKLEIQNNRWGQFEVNFSDPHWKTRSSKLSDSRMLPWPKDHPVFWKSSANLPHFGPDCLSQLGAPSFQALQVHPQCEHKTNSRLRSETNHSFYS